MRFAVAGLVLASAAAAQTVAGQAGFSVREALSAPFSNGLTASPVGARVAWFTDAEGRRNVWVAGAHEAARQVTHSADDDGQDLDDLTWSRDGEQLAWTRGTGAQGAEHPVANPAELPGPVRQVVVVADLRSGSVREIAEGRAPLFSGDGHALYFLRHGNVWTVSLEAAASAGPVGETRTPGEADRDGTGEANGDPEVGGRGIARQLLYVRGTADGLRLSPDGTRLLFVSHRGDHSFIGVYTVGTHALQWMDPGVDVDHDAVWSPDGRSIAFVREVPIVSPIADRWMREGAPWSIRVADAETGEGREVWRADAGAGSLFHGVGAHDQLLWMRDGRIVFPWEKGGWTRLYALSLSAGGKVERLSDGDAEVDGVATDGIRVVWSSNRAGGSGDGKDVDRRHLFREGGGGTRLTGGDSIETSPAVLSDGTVAMLGGDARRPLIPLLLSAGGGLRAFAPQLVPASFPANQFVTPQQVVFSAADGLLIHGQLFLPRDVKPGARLPAVVFFHGGSRRQMLLGFHPMQYYAQTYEFNQYLAGRGFAVLSVNYRSGTGYGLNVRQALNYGANGASEYNDVVGAAKYLASRPDVDARRIAAWGGSYGGYLTALALARSSDLFCAGVDLHGVHDWSLELELWKPTDEPGVDQAAIARRAFQSSPMADVDRWKSPVLLVQGDDDRNVLFAQTVRLAAALRARRVPVEVLALPDEVHDFLLHRDWVRVLERAGIFLENNCSSRPPI